MTFNAILMNQHNGKTQAELTSVSEDDLPEGDVLIEVDYSTLNYKDGLAVTGVGKIIRNFPMIPGIDLAGKIKETSSDQYQVGDEVILTGWGVGENHWGGYAELARLKSDWLVPLPVGMTTQQAMSIGTAGFTAMMCVLALEEQGCQPDRGEILVTGASGGVGSVAVAILAKLGYQVVASTGRTNLHDYLTALGASEIIERSILDTTSKRPLESGRWAGAVDTVGGDTLATILRTMKPESTVACCGLAGGHHLNTTVMPFILRGVTLTGTNSVTCPRGRRLQIWKRLVQDLSGEVLDQMTKVVSLGEVLSLSKDILAGQVQGRVVVDVKRS